MAKHMAEKRAPDGFYGSEILLFYWWDGARHRRKTLSKEYSKLTSLTIAKAILAKKQEDYTVTIIIDGFNNKERDVVREELKKLNIRYRKIRGMKDEQSVFLRLADAMAGFLREAYEKEVYTAGYIGRFIGAKIVTET